MFSWHNRITCSIIDRKNNKNILLNKSCYPDISEKNIFLASQKKSLWSSDSWKTSSNQSCVVSCSLQELSLLFIYFSTLKLLNSKCLLRQRWTLQKWHTRLSLTGTTSFKRPKLIKV